jgi:hypothetical protein
MSLPQDIAAQEARLRQMMMISSVDGWLSRRMFCHSMNIFKNFTL